MAKLTVIDRFHEYGADWQHRMGLALIDGIEATLEAAHETVPKGKTGKLEGSLRWEIRQTSRGLLGVVYAAEFYGRFLEYGTLRRRKKKLRRPEARQTPSGAARYAKVSDREGIAPRRFMLKAGRLGRPAFVEAVAHACRDMEWRYGG